MTYQLYNGDCLELMGLIPDGSMDAIITDPPYGIDYQSSWRTDKNTRQPKILNDKHPFIWFLHTSAKKLKQGGVMVCFCRWDVQEAFKQAMGWAGLHVKSQVIWNREVHGMGDLKASFAPQHDVIWFAVKGTSFSFPGKRPKSVLTSQRLSGAELTHPNEKPIDLMLQLVEATTYPGATVLDPFLGSGTTGVACINIGRNFIGIEKAPCYFEIAQKRIEEAERTEAQLALKSGLG